FILAGAAHPNEYRRKNCRLITDAASGSCVQPSFGLVEPGVDPNRNYGGFWGGPGASTDRTSQTYRGPGPFSEPETQNVRQLVSQRHVTTLITNHTFSNLVLRPPGIQSQGPTPDEGIYKALGDAMAAENGYASQLSYQLYDTTGTTEDWTYYSTGGLGFTFEIGPHNFHPPFEETVAEWEGTSEASDGHGRDGRGNREAYFIAQGSTADTSRHGVLAGRAPADATLRLKKTFQTPTSQRNADGSPRTFEDTLDSTMQVDPDGRFEWHVNPSTRPLVAEDRGREATGDPSPPQELSSRGGTVPCANFDDPPPSCYEDHKITVPGGAGIDNAKATIRIEWPTPVSDWDMKVYRADADGNAGGEPVGVSGQGTTDFEQVVLGEPEPGDYVVRVINWAAVEPWSGEVTFAGPDPFQPAMTETYTLFCEQPEGTIHSARQVGVDRGERRSLDLRADCARRR
ncbi:MAG: M14 family zinc carboxypeptidase, partial [Nocardioidaceae bacterium]